MKWLILFIALLSTSARAVEPAPNWRYQLLEGSFLMDDCLICGQPNSNAPMRGSFDLRQAEVTPFSQRYSIENAEFTAGAEYTFKGSGAYELVGDFAVRQVITLSGVLQTSNGTNKVAFTNESTVPTRRWPMLKFGLNQTNGTSVSAITLDIAAAPFREIWFSTAFSFLRDVVVNDIAFKTVISGGDLLSCDGRVVESNLSLNNFPGSTYSPGLDAVDILPGGEIAFSPQTTGSWDNGTWEDGDIVFAKTGTIRYWQNFMRLVAPGLTIDPGLDALHLEGSNTIYFSTRQNLNSGTIGHGDILVADTDAQTGTVFKKNSDLLARFHPATTADYGLDALYIWPNGEIWFSTATGFSDNEVGTITDGDLLSDAGYIVYRNLELIDGPQAAGKTSSTLGLDAIYVVSDFAATASDVTLNTSLNRENNSVTLSWGSLGRVFQIIRATDVNGPWQAVTPIILGSQYSEPLSDQHSFYRLTQW